MAYKIDVTVDPPFRRGARPDVIRAAARAALRHQRGPDPGEISVLITGDAAVRRLNREFLGEDHVTDVLSFPSGEINPETGARYLGDIALAYPRARSQAQAGRHPVRAELQLLVVHAVLHLLGHDHAEPAEKARMWTAQAEILKRLKSPLSGPGR